MKEFHSYYKTVGGGEGERCKHPTRLDMYGCGCAHNCNYCYAKSLLEFRDLWNPDQPRCIDKRTAVKIMDRIPKGTIIRLGGMTDPFQPLEDRYHLTEWAIGELNKRRIGYLIVTKGASVAKCRNLHPQLAHIQVFYTYTEGLAPDDYEQASLPEDRLKAAESLHRRGFDVQLRLSPYVPQYIDSKRVLDSPIEKIVMEFLRVNPFIRRNMPYMDFTEWTETNGNYQHLPLRMKMAYLTPFIEAGKRVTVCEDHPDHYDYFMKNVNANPDDCCDLRV